MPSLSGRRRTSQPAVEVDEHRAGNVAGPIGINAGAAVEIPTDVADDRALGEGGDDRIQAPLGWVVQSVGSPRSTRTTNCPLVSEASSPLP